MTAREVIGLPGWAIAGVLIFFIRIYQRTVSWWMPKICRFEPSCSHYFVQALRKRGLVVGFALGCWRLLRCQPFATPGYDPVPGPGERIGVRPFPEPGPSGAHPHPHPAPPAS